jgi:hypothetical protein
LSLRPVLRRVKILTDPIPFKMQGEKIKFEVESNHTAAVEVKLFIRPDGTKMLAIPGGCKGKSLAKMGDKCSEEIECEAKQGKNDVVLMAISEPAGADMVDVKGC